MLSSRFGALLRDARKRRGLSRAELAGRGGVSARLVAEVERGERPNVSLETALRLLGLVGLSVSDSPRQRSGPRGLGPADIERARAERAVRAEIRRQTWTGGHVKLKDSGNDPAPPRSAAARFAAVAEASQLAYAIAKAAKGKARGKKS